MAAWQGEKINRRGFIAAAGAIALVAPKSSGGRRVAAPPLKYHLFLPAADSRRPLLVLVHGVSTEPETLVELLAVEAARHGRPLMTPHFADDVFDDYQRLGPVVSPLESARALVTALAEAFKRMGVAQAPVDLMGFSGGAQFVHRFGLFFPKLVRRRMAQPFTQADKARQLEWRGRYAEFNLIYDRGTLFGLRTGGNVDAILMSLPPVAAWN